MFRCCLAALLALLLPTVAVTDERLDVKFARYEAALDSTLHSRSPAAQELFRRANAARDSNQVTRSIDLYTQVITLAPDFGPAVRRRAVQRLKSGDRVTAISDLQALLLRDSTGYNHSALALALLNKPAGESPTYAEVNEAKPHALRAIELDEDDVAGWQSCWLVAVEERDSTLMRRALQAFQRLLPNTLPEAFADLTYQIAVGHDSHRADAALGRAVQLGLPEESAAHARGAIAALRGEERNHAVLVLAGVCILAWLGLFLVLFLAGVGLSRVTSHAASAALADPTGRAIGLSGWLRRTYRAVLWLSCGYYWLSIPLVLVFVIALGGGLVYLSFAVGHVPIKLVLIVVVLTFVTVASILRSMIVRGRDEDPGIRLELDEFPRLRDTLVSVAGRVDTRAVDTVFATPGPEVAVFERGDLRSQLRGHAERCLILGIGVLDGMTVGQFRSVLAHEYGHFSNRDTAGGGFALSVRRSLFTMAGHLARGGAAGWYNPAWLFLRAFHGMFMRISQGASRLQEVLADRWAAVTCGSAAFVAGLRHVIEASVRFDAHVNTAVNEALKQRRPLPNLYQFSTTPSAEDASAVDAGITRALEAEPSEYDSHPTPRQRFDWVTALAIEAEPEPGDSDDAWSLFPDREGLERRLTEQVRGQIEQSYGVEFATADSGS